MRALLIVAICAVHPTTGWAQPVSPAAAKVRAGSFVISKSEDDVKAIKLRNGVEHRLPNRLSLVRGVRRGEVILGASFEATVSVVQALRYVAKEDAHVAKIQVTVTDVKGRVARQTFRQALSFVASAPSATAITPAEHRVTETNTFKTFTIVSDAPGDDFVARIHSPFSPEGVPVEVPRVAPRFVAEATSSEIFGFGLGTTEIAVEVNPSLIGDRRGRIVFSTKQGRAVFGAARLDLNDEGTARTDIRSLGMEPALIEARILPLDEVIQFEIRYLSPWRWFLFVAVGAGLGALTGVLLIFRSAERPVRATVIGFFIGVIAGVVATVAYSQGLVFGFSVPSIGAEFGAVFIAFLSALFPQRFLRRLAGDRAVY